MISQIILYIMVFFAVLGALDRIVFNNKFGLGQQFENGINVMGPLALAMVGLMCFAPVLGNILTPIFSPLYSLIGADPAMISGSLLALDMGGYPLAQAMTSDPEIIVLSGLILGSMLGCTIVFAIPVALGIVEKEDRSYLAQGIMIGIIAIPFGCLVSGLLAGIAFTKIIINLFSVIILALILVIGLLKNPTALMKCFDVFAKFITAILFITLTAAIVENFTEIVVIPGMNPIGPQLEIVGYIAITLAGAYPLVSFITRSLSSFLKKFGKILNINEVAVGGLIAVLANSIPVYAMVKDMDNRGKIITIAFSVPAATAFGDHLGYVSANAPEYIFPIVVGKLFAGFLAIGLALLILKYKKSLVD